MRARGIVVTALTLSVLALTNVAAQRGAGPGQGAAPPTVSAPPAPPAEWTSYGGNLANHRYSPLAQLTRENIGTVRVAWRWKSDNYGPSPEYR
ncbi:MAG: hypothetical protein KAY59_09550, partial [Acidobacteria bacterium]|nr:hypothetical protein [Acidobacteriota bacterium]